MVEDEEKPRVKNNTAELTWRPPIENPREFGVEKQR